jgi:hypothetical protein
MRFSDSNPLLIRKLIRKFTMHRKHSRISIAPLMAAMLALAPMIAAADDGDFVEALTPCMKYVRDDADGQTPQLVLDQGWLALMISRASDGGGGLIADLCGELGNGGLAFGGAYQWPEALQHSERVSIDRSRIDQAWLKRVIATARSHAKSKHSVNRITITALPDGDSVVRVFFAIAESGADSSVDLSMDAVVQRKNAQLPDQLSRQVETTHSKPPVAEAMAAPTIDPWSAFAQLLTHSQANRAGAKVSRVVFSSFAANLEYRDAANIGRVTRFDFLNGSAGNLKDELHTFPAAFKACALTLSEIKAALAHLRQETKHQDIAPRLQHLMLQCSADKPNPHWNLIAMEPFEYFDLPANLQKP